SGTCRTLAMSCASFGCALPEKIAIVASSTATFLLDLRCRFMAYPKLRGMAGVAGFEPANDGIKTRCLTTWLHPNRANCAGRLMKNPVVDHQPHLGVAMRGDHAPRHLLSASLAVCIDLHDPVPLFEPRQLSFAIEGG